MIFRAAISGDGSAIAAIHAEGLATGHASFREDAMHAEEALDAFSLLLVAQGADGVCGFAGVSPTSSRPVYAGVGEVSLYVAANAAGQGVGRGLLTRLVAQAQDAGWWTLVAQIFPENAASIALHRACGFRVLGTRERLGQMTHGPMAGQWRDVVMMERRAP